MNNRVFVFGNGASIGIACDNSSFSTKNNFSNPFMWATELLNKIYLKEGISLDVENAASTVKDRIESIVLPLRTMGALKNGYTFDEYRKINPEIDKFFTDNSIGNIVNSIVDDAFSPGPGGYGLTEGYKRNLLVGYLAGNSLQTLHELQTYITSLFCLTRTNNNVYNDFSKLLMKENGQKVINFNWDNLFETAYRKESGLELNHKFIPNQIAIDTKLPISEDSVSILKPHGSIEYLACQRDFHRNLPGCFRITISSDLHYLRKTSSDKQKCHFYRHNSDCSNHHNLLPFTQPYTRIENSMLAYPFCRMAMESIEEFMTGIDELVVIGYSFSKDSKGWIDYDFWPIFNGKKIKIISRDYQEAFKISERIKKEEGFNDVSPLAFNGFEDYVSKSMTKGKLLQEDY